MQHSLTRSALALLFILPQTLTPSNRQGRPEILCKYGELVGAALVAGGAVLTYQGLSAVNEGMKSLQENQGTLPPGINPTELFITTLCVLFRSFGGAGLMGIGSALIVNSDAAQDFCERWSDQTDTREKASSTEPLSVQLVPPARFRKPRVIQLAECNHCNRVANKKKKILSYACGHEYHESCIRKKLRSNTLVPCCECQLSKK